MLSTNSNLSLYKFLNERLIEINKNRDAIERECSIIQSLLKPWPKKKENKTEVNIELNLKENIGNSEIVNQTANQLSTEEKQALEQVDVLLRKAQKTRQLKANDPIKHEAKVNVQPASNPEISSAVDTLEGSKLTNQHLQVFNTNQTRSDRKSNKQNPLKSNRCFSAVENSSTSSNVCSVSKTADQKIKSQSSTISVDKRKHLDQGISQTNSNMKLSGSVSATRRPEIKNSHYVPAHKLAPFKTNESSTLKVLKRSFKHSHTAKVASLNNSKSKTVNRHKTLPGISLQNDKEELARHQNKNNSKIDSEISVDGSKSNDQDIVKVDRPTHNMVKERIPSTPHPESSISDTEGLKEGTNVKTDEIFTLQANGHNLKLPGKLIQLVEKNQTLRNRCSAAKLIKRVHEKDPAQQYIEKLESQHEVSRELWTRVSAQTCLKSHHILLNTFESLHLEEISDTTPSDVILRAKRILEFILSSFARLQKEAVYYSKAKFTNYPSLEIKPKEDNFLDKMWLDSEQNIKDTGQSYLQDHLKSHKRWTQLNFTEKYLKLQISIAELVQSEWWDFLISGCREHIVLQSVYGLMTTSGSVLPALVKNLENVD